jgi:hypothetical protein
MLPLLIKRISSNKQINGDTQPSGPMYVFNDTTHYFKFTMDEPRDYTWMAANTNYCFNLRLEWIDEPNVGKDNGYFRIICNASETNLYENGNRPALLSELDIEKFYRNGNISLLAKNLRTSNYIPIEEYDHMKTVYNIAVAGLVMTVIHLFFHIVLICGQKASQQEQPEENTNGPTYA